MGQQREHSGHNARTQEHIALAREHYDTRAQRRPRQVWIAHDSWDHSTFAAPKGAKGAVPAKIWTDFAATEEAK